METREYKANVKVSGRKDEEGDIAGIFDPLRIVMYLGDNYDCPECRYFSPYYAEGVENAVDIVETVLPRFTRLTKKQGYAFIDDPFEGAERPVIAEEDEYLDPSDAMDFLNEIFNEEPWDIDWDKKDLEKQE
ncbi:hypothetical protein DMB44_04250 [Thermoplasma sp. Kam2015]|uniref:hypothetical protein n=1 Tax=Thermoplasma sp. Kam2015 TaxID=2094122 RepID=UPI000D831C8D|nr:hypothetical protein [Thermoplasma sp. Kam2015]PYB68552.1 hypothetical protein DMB44_04250 [Thermoplasma sp. Kam2015]